MKDKDLVIVAIIPARGGSKGLPKKNIKELCGKPLICYTIESAIKSNLIDRIVVSTDDEEIARIASKYHEINVCMRPSELSTDTASTASALIHACNFLNQNESIDIDYVLTLEPTSPFRSLNTIKKTINLLTNGNFDSVVTVTEFKSVLAKVIENRFSHVFPNQPRRRQDRKGLYQESSTIYGTAYKKLIEKNQVIGDAPAGLIVNQNEALDINDEFDFQIANFMMELSKK